MYKQRTILGIIPARGGSRGLARKNIREMAGKPLIAWTIEKAASSKYLDRVIVSTDNVEISRIAKRFGAEVPFIRPDELAEDKTPMLDVIIHAVEYLRKNNRRYDYIALLEPTSPLRKENDIDRAIIQLIDYEKEADSLISVGEVHLEHPSIMKEIKEGYVKAYEKVTKNITRRQDLNRVYFPYGVIYLAKTDKLIEYGTFYQERTVPFCIERWQNYEVDDIYDFMCIEAVIKHELEEIAK